MEWPYVIQLRRTGGNRPVEVRTKPEGPDESHEVPAHISERINVERTAGLTARFPGRVRGRASAQGLRWHPSLWTWRRRTHQAPRPNREGQRPNWLLSGHLIDAGRVRTTSPQRRRPPVRREPPRNNGVASARQDAKPRDIGSGPGQRCEQPQNRPTAARWAGRPAIRQPAGPLRHRRAWAGLKQLRRGQNIGDLGQSRRQSPGGGPAAPQSSTGTKTSRGSTKTSPGGRTSPTTTPGRVPLRRPQPATPQASAGAGNKHSINPSKGRPRTSLGTGPNTWQNCWLTANA